MTNLSRKIYDSWIAFYCFVLKTNTEQKTTFFIKHPFSKCDHIYGFVQIWTYLLKNSLIVNLSSFF